MEMTPLHGLEILQHKIPGDEICYGCGHEHNCRVHGCAMIRPAVNALNEEKQAIRALDSLASWLECQKRSYSVQNDSDPVLIDVLDHVRRTIDEIADDLDEALSAEHYNYL